MCLAGKIDPLLEHFLAVLATHGRLGHLEQIADAYDNLFDEQLGKIEVDVTVAKQLSGRNWKMYAKKKCRPP